MNEMKRHPASPEEIFGKLQERLNHGMKKCEAVEIYGADGAVQSTTITIKYEGRVLPAPESDG